MTLFAIMKGECSVSKANLPKQVNSEIIVEWKQTAAWVEWWTRKRHLCKQCYFFVNKYMIRCLYTAMLSHHFSTMSEQFNSLPTSTNAVESYNQLSKVNKPEILCVALLTTYKIDMASALEHMARSDGLSTDYSERNDEYRLGKTMLSKSPV